ncbi:MAG: hypothetical protein J0M12_07310 [Deltaproteobacteria bacterium]|nr:hypothetical protein [Deltaproteobacteria bacterium]
MKHFITLLAVLVTCTLSTPLASFAATEKDTAFTDAYKKAFENKDAIALNGFLYTKGADPEVLGFYTMMMTAEMGNKISSIELVELTPEDVKKATSIQPLPSGENAKLPLTPVKKLVVKVASTDENGTSTSTSESFVAEYEGKYVIPVPGPVK